jgi:hypothetical protein
MTKEQCSSCKFWKMPMHQDDLQLDDREGTCRRYPSVLIGSESDGLGMACQEASHWAQPVMYAVDWCGEYKPAAT